MYIDEVPNRNSPPAVLLRESYREGNKVLKRTLANLTKWPSSVVEGLRLLLRGGTAIERFAGSFEIVRSLPHGHVAAVLGTLSKLKLKKLIAPERSAPRDRVLAMIVARVLDPRSKLATARGFGEETASSSLGELLAVEAAEAEDLQLSLFDQRDLVEITSLEYPGERLIVCRNPALAEDRTREALLQATKRELDKIVTATSRSKRRLQGQDHIGLRFGLRWLTDSRWPNTPSSRSPRRVSSINATRRASLKRRP